jgi:hypothetical protein
MLNRYRRAARTAAELGLGDLLPLDTAIPELAGLDTPGGGTTPGGGIVGGIVGAPEGSASLALRNPQQSSLVAPVGVEPTRQLRPWILKPEGMVAQRSQWSLSEENEGERDDQRRPIATGADDSERASDDSRGGGRAGLLGRLASELADLAAAGDLEGARIVSEAITRLLGTAAPGASLIDLEDERRRRAPR